MNKNIYTQNEVSEIFRKAAQLEAERKISRENESSSGLSLSEIEQIAAESGIDPELIRDVVNHMGDDNQFTEEASVKRDEIVSERWLDVAFTPSITDDIVTELNHKYGTSDKDITWWDDLWKNYDGKAKVRKSNGSLEWQYSDEFGMYTTRVLVQSRGERLRIRVSKRQFFKMNWNQGQYDFTYPLVLTPVFMILGGTATLTAMGSIWPGVTIGILLGSLLYPSVKYFREKSIKKHRDEVTDTANTLTELTLQLLKNQKTTGVSEFVSSKAEMDFKEIEISEFNPEPDETTSLRNNLREKN